MASGIEIRQSMRASQRFELMGYAVCGGVALCVAAFVGLGVVIWNTHYNKPAGRGVEIAQAPKSAARRGGVRSVENDCQRQMRQVAVAVNVGLILSDKGREHMRENGALTFDQADELCSVFAGDGSFGSSSGITSGRRTRRDD